MYGYINSVTDVVKYYFSWSPGCKGIKDAYDELADQSLGFGTLERKGYFNKPGGRMFNIGMYVCISQYKSLFGFTNHQFTSYFISYVWYNVRLPMHQRLCD